MQILKTLQQLLLVLIFLLFSYQKSKAQDLSIADKYYESEEYAKAAHEYEKVLPRIKKIYGAEDTSVYAPAIFRAASSYNMNSEFDKAEKYFEEGTAIYQSTENGKEDFWFIIFANSLDFLYNNQGEKYEKEKNYIKAKQYYLKSLKFVELNFGKHNYGYPETCKKLAGLYIKTKEYDKAESLYNEALRIDEKLYGKEHWRVAETCKSMEAIFKQKGEFEKAKEFYQKAVNTKNIFSNNDDLLDYASSCNRLANLYYDFGNFSEAELLYIKAKKIRAQVLGEENPVYSESCNKLARLYMSLGNYDKAESLFIESKNIREKTFGKKNPLYAQSCNNLGALYNALGNFDQAKILYFEAYEIRKKTVGKNSKAYAISCNNIALVYFVEKNYQDAEKYLLEAKNIITKIGKNSTFYVQICNNMGMLYEIEEQYKKSKRFYIEAISIQEKILGKKNPAYLSICNNLARINEITNNKKAAERYYKENNELLLYILNESSEYMSEKEREKYLRIKINPDFEINHSFFIKRSNHKEKFTGIVYNNALNLKGQLLKSTIALRKAILQSGDTALISKYKQANAYGKILTEQYLLPNENRRQDIQLIEDKLNKLEKELTRIAAENPKNKKLFTQNNDWRNIQKSLKQNDIAIEFIKFKYAGVKYWTDSILYYALILKKDFDTPKAIFLFEEKKLQNLLNRQDNEDDFRYIKRLYTTQSPESDSLYTLIFKPLESHLNNIKSIHISPTGLLNKIAFDALVSSKDSILSDKYNIFYSSTTASIIDNTGLYPKDIKDVVLFGGIDYDLTPEQMMRNADKIKQTLDNDNKLNNFNISIDTLKRSVSWSYLEGSKLETEKIDQLVSHKNISVQLYSGQQGSEEQFKALEIDAPSVIHVSTHGFYFGNDKKSLEYKAMIDDKIKFAHSDNPLMRSGFILAGGNAAFQGRTIPRGVEDGVLTAAEISQMNLFNTKLAVLSACQTGLGDVKGNEGVYGLQRAFKMAGVEYLLISLWEVPDYQTRELMSNFYENWFSGMNVQAAFKKAQNQLKIKYAKIKGSAFAWAAFVLIK
ncbi:MAG: CHAT domain-containing protein [Bacteroidales bacterium]|nr:CHAT domain-containing protein [Bacteroidales bacterium]